MKTIFLTLFIVTNVLSFSQSNKFQNFLESPGINLGPDFNLCPGNIHLLDAGPGFDSYIWQDGSTSQTYMVTEGGTFWVHAYIGTTMYADTINIYYWPYPDPNLGNDTILCQGSTLILEPPSGFVNYEWQNGSNLPFCMVTSPGLYFVTVTDVHGCVGSDTIMIEYSDFEIDLGIDTIICLCDSVLLDAGDGFFNYEWQDGSTDRYFLVVAENYGIGSHDFYVTAVDSNNCEVSDTIMIFIDDFTKINSTSGSDIWIYPNPANDFITLDLDRSFGIEYSIEIFNLLGIQVYQNDGMHITPGNDLRLDIGHLNAGIYLLQVQGSQTKYIRKFMIR